MYYYKLQRVGRWKKNSINTERAEWWAHGKWEQDEDDFFFLKEAVYKDAEDDGIRRRKISISEVHGETALTAAWKRGGHVAVLHLYFHWKMFVPLPHFQMVLNSGSTWILGLIRATCQGLTRTCYPSVSDEWALSLFLSSTHTKPCTHACIVRVCNRNQLGFQGRAVGQTGPFITL